MSHDDITLAMSYYILYCNLASEELAVCNEISTTSEMVKDSSDSIFMRNATANATDDSTTAAAEVFKETMTNAHTMQQRNNENFDDNIPWFEDEWTVQDELAASKLLEESCDRCRIRNRNSTTSALMESSDDIEAWDRFYRNHQTNFFKDRHYFAVAFPHEFTMDNTATAMKDTNKKINNNPDCSSEAITKRCLVEIGCGVGNAMLPLLDQDESASLVVDERQQIQWTVYGFDLSATAIDMVRSDPRFRQASVQGRASCDVRDVSIPNALPFYVQNIANATSLLFCLSAIHPSKHLVVLQNIVSTLRPGTGVLIFRDYGRYDVAQIKLGTQRSKLIEDNFYRKQDGTKCYYFTVEDVERLIEQVGEFEILECNYIRRKYINRSMQSERRRVWVQGRFRRRVVSPR
jgi:SAM-dependent methyltransferase